METENRVYKRKIYERMLHWKHSKNGKSALLIKGARRVGKSTIAEAFAKNEYTSYLVVNFDNAPQAVWEAVANIADLDNFFFQLQFIYQVRLIERKSVVIFDEIQKAPAVRQAIKYMVQDHRYDYIETGSLLSIKKNVKNITIPSEETRLTMYPLDYEEFRWALGDEVTIPLMKEALNKRRSLGDQVNRKLLQDFRLYMLIGGMPQALNTYLETNNLQEVDQTKREIIELYADDFRKIDPSGRALRLFMAIPSELAKNSSRYQAMSIIGRKAENVDMNQLLEDMEDSLCVNFVYYVNAPSVGLALHKNKDRYKLFVGDTGLFITLAFWDKDVTENVIYQKLLFGKLSADLGYVYENVVAQMLTVAGNKLYYHTWPTPNGKHNYEIDFIISRRNKLCPIEVKSSGYKVHRSLDQFCEKYSSEILYRYLIYTKDLRQDGDVMMVPVYMTGLL
ncbi:MAG: AAA family ATPase [Prevotella sp.]|jgi:predicted AAA+ superfamily ATPase|nr:AAA family ATPase [Prevotella sp.]MCH4240451.1 AAA family ATPase [Prevotella sp.]